MIQKDWLIQVNKNKNRGPNSQEMNMALQVLQMMSVSWENKK